MQAVIFGSIGTLAETSDLQRAAFNAAFAEQGLDWHWDLSSYRRLLMQSGGQDRITAFAKSRGEKVDAAAIHARKSELFQQALARGVALRPGVGATLRLARARGWRLVLASGTSAANVDAVLTATGLARADFDLVFDAASGLPPKPAYDVFEAALTQLALSPQDAIAIEDNPDGFDAARAAGLACVAFPGRLHEGDTGFNGALVCQTTLDISAVTY